LSCVLRGSSLVRAVVHHAVLTARRNSVIGSNALFAAKGIRMSGSWFYGWKNWRF